MPKEKNIFHKGNKNLYLLTHDFIAPDRNQTLYRLFYAKDEDSLKKLIYNYLMNYYGTNGKAEKYKNMYLYFDGIIGNAFIGYEQILNCKQLVDKLL